MIKDIVVVKIGYVILKSVIGLLQKVQKKGVILALFGAKIIRLPSCSRGAAARDDTTSLAAGRAVTHSRAC